MQSFAWPTPVWDGHLLFLHRTELDRQAAVAAWVTRGLERGERVVYIAPRAEPARDSLQDLLRRHGTDVGAAVQTGQLQVLAAEPDLYSLSGQVGLVDLALQAGFPAVRISAEADTAHPLVDEEEHAELERAMDQLCHSRPVSALCQYRHDLAPMMLHAVCGMHSDGVLETQLRVRATAAGVCVSGDVDVSNHAILRSALRTVVSREREELTVDLAQLEFMDVGGARALMSATDEYRHGGGQLRLRGARRPVRRLLDLLEVGSAPGVVLEET